MRILIAVIFLLLSAQPSQSNQTQPGQAQSQPVLAVLNESAQIFINENCKLNNTCGLKSVIVSVKNWEIMIGGSPHYGTTMIVEYETDSVENLENYGFVQFIRGCVFDSIKMPDGAILRSIVPNRIKHFGQFPKSCFPRWLIDAFDSDPFLTATAKGRMYGWLWNAESGSTEKTTEQYYGRQKPSASRLYYKDTPGTAFTMDGAAKNISWEFKLCLYKSRDIPMETTEDNLDFAVPIFCFYWASSHIYNHEKKIFETKMNTDPFCEKCADTP